MQLQCTAFIPSFGAEAMEYVFSDATRMENRPRVAYVLLHVQTYMACMYVCVRP